MLLSPLIRTQTADSSLSLHTQEFYHHVSNQPQEHGKQTKKATKLNPQNVNSYVQLLCSRTALLRGTDTFEAQKQLQHPAVMSFPFFRCVWKFPDR